MRRFRFPLARLERLRRHGEMLARRELATRVSAVAALDSALQTVDANLEACHAIDGRGRAFGEALANGLRSVRVRLDRRRGLALAEAERARVRYAERRRDVQALAQLHESRRAEWRTDVEREEQAERDELARVRFVRAEAAR